MGSTLMGRSCGGSEKNTGRGAYHEPADLIEQVVRADISARTNHESQIRQHDPFQGPGLNLFVAHRRIVRRKSNEIDPRFETGAPPVTSRSSPRPGRPVSTKALRDTGPLS